MLLAAFKLGSTPLVALLSMKSRPLVSVERPRPATFSVAPGDIQDRGTGLVECQLELVAEQQVDAVKGGVLRCRVDLRQDVIVLRDQICAGVLRNQIGYGRD